MPGRWTDAASAQNLDNYLPQGAQHNLTFTLYLPKLDLTGTGDDMRSGLCLNHGPWSNIYFESMFEKV